MATTTNEIDAPKTLKVGDAVWIFDINHRVYAKSAEDIARHGRGPIWREHWVKHTITGETSRSWLCGPSWKPDAIKVPKKGASAYSVAFSEEDIERRAWIERHARELGEHVSRSQDYALLRHIADLVGYNGREGRW